MNVNTIIVAVVASFCLYMLYYVFISPKINGGKINDIINAYEQHSTAHDTVVDTVQKFDLMFSMAEKFVIAAKQKFKDGEGEVKRDWATQQLKGVAEKIHLDISDEALLAINEDAYIKMIKKLTKKK